MKENTIDGIGKNHSFFSKSSDEFLCEKVREGCIHSKIQLYEKYRDYVRRLIFSHTTGMRFAKGEMKDAQQEMYFAFEDAVKRFKNVQQYAGNTDTSFKTFLTSVVYHHLSHCNDKTTNYKKYFHVTDFQEQRCDDDVTNTDVPERNFTNEVDNNYQEDKNRFIEEKLEALDLKTYIVFEIMNEEVANALLRLKEKEMNLMCLWLLHKRDKKDVGEVLGLSQTAVRLRRERIFKKIRAMIQNELKKNDKRNKEK